MVSFGICTSWNQAECLSRCAEYIEENAQKILVGTEDESVFLEKIKGIEHCSLPIAAVNCFIPGNLPCIGPKRDWERLFTYATRVIERAGRLGIQIIVFGSGGSRALYEGVNKAQAENDFVQFCQAIAPIAQKNQVTIVVEPLNRKECNFINTVAEGATIVHKVNHPAVRLLADVFHMLRNEENPDTDLAPYVSLIRHVHVAEKNRRTPPGVERDNFVPYFRVLKQAGYQGRISIEASWDTTLPFPEQAYHALQYLREQWGQA